MGLSNGAYTLGLIIGPLLHGALYAINIQYPWLFGGALVLLGGLVMVGMVLKWPELRVAQKSEIEQHQMTTEQIANWKYIPDKVRRKDYIRLGKALGVMLSDKNYYWIQYFDRLMVFLDTVFTTINTTYLEQRIQEINLLFRQIDQAREVEWITIYCSSYSKNIITISLSNLSNEYNHSFTMFI